MDQFDRCTKVAAEKQMEAARAICQARCASRDRDYNCQETGRCGTNWQMFEHHVLRLMTGSVL